MPLCSSCPVELPHMRIAMPPAIIAIMARTFTRLSQNSTSPKTLTLSRFIAPMKKMIDSTQTQRGTPGNQKPM
ncbi:Uncharacterised protein [Mycobacteroides abscessus subsp. abscessus]|nr:Uncharacterised protein [Mycobacteroides abscessus subsp. abscessus]